MRLRYSQVVVVRGLTGTRAQAGVLAGLHPTSSSPRPRWWPPSCHLLTAVASSPSPFPASPGPGNAEGLSGLLCQCSQGLPGEPPPNSTPSLEGTHRLGSDESSSPMASHLTCGLWEPCRCEPYHLATNYRL